MPAPTDNRAANKFKVPQKTWGSWTLVARHVFNKTFESMQQDQENFRHPNSLPVDDKHWKTTAWNAAFIAAMVCSRGERHLLKDLTQKVKG